MTEAEAASVPGLHGGALRNGKTTRTRRVLLEELAASGHVHYLNREGTWCVTDSRIGPLWELLPQPTVLLELEITGRYAESATPG